MPTETDEKGIAMTTETTDSRYTAEQIAGYDDNDLSYHLEERLAQRDRCKRDMTRIHELLARLDDPDSPTYRTALDDLSNYTREHAELNRAIRHLEVECSRRSLTAIAREAADGRVPMVELLDEELANRGFPLGIDEAGDKDAAAALWMHATMALEAQTDDTPTNAEVAGRVADAYAVLYGYSTVA